ncbi:MAG: hypothetical protein GXP30_09915 [Verrucomicrobia bacterium]|nr:hypothetical protein [Verrucomicrobiota bacterium]
MNNSTRIRLFLFVLLICFSNSSLSQGKEIPLALIPIEGNQAASANQILTYEIKRCGFFYLAKPEPGAYVVKGRFVSKGLEGEFFHPDGRKLFKRTYSAGKLKRDARQFADDIVLAATGRPGIATSQIAFIGNQNGKTDIFICDYDGKNIRQITKDGLPKRHPSLSPNGTILFFTGSAGQSRGIFQIDLRTNQRKQIVATSGSNHEKAIVSPDGKRLAIALAEGNYSDLYVAKVSGKSRKQLFKSRIAEHQPSWSADGKALVYTTGIAPEKTQLFTARIKNGSPPTPLAITLPNPSQANWSPDGHRIAFVSENSGNKSIAIHDLRDRSTRVLVAGQAPVWGADSRHLIYTSSGNLYRIDADTGEKTSVISGGGQIYDPSWTR